MFVPLGTFEVVDVSGVVNVSAKPEIEMVQVAIRTLGETGDGSPIYFSEAIGTDYTATWTASQERGDQAADWGEPKTLTPALWLTASWFH